ncbi:sugar ABC transporter substrate-binding protein [Streptomyces sp. NPDC002004]
MLGAGATTAVCALTFSLTACGGLLGSDDGGKARKTTGDAVRIGLLLPEREAERYEKFDRPIIEKHIKELTHGKATVDYANAEQDAAKQSAQLGQMVADKVDTVLLDAVDAKGIAPAVKKAKEAGVHVIAYDRLAEGPVDGYVTFDSDLVGQVQGQALLEALGDRAKPTTKIVMMNGSPTDPNAAIFKRGALSELQNNVDIAKSYDTTDWKPENARANMQDAISALGARNIAGVYSANDGMAGGVIAALKAAGLTTLPPVTGQDSDLPAVQRIVSGEQYMSVYKPYPDEAESAAEMAVQISQGHMIEYESLALDKSDNASTKSIPTHLVQVRPLTQKSIRSTVIRDGIYTVREICTPKYLAACKQLGLKG